MCALCLFLKNKHWISFRTFKNWRPKMKGWSQKIVLSLVLCPSWPLMQLQPRHNNNSNNMNNFGNNNKVRLEPWFQVDPPTRVLLTFHSELKSEKMCNFSKAEAHYLLHYFSNFRALCSNLWNRVCSELKSEIFKQTFLEFMANYKKTWQKRLKINR